MEYVNLGNSGLKVSRLCFGTMTFGGEGRFKDIGSIGLTEATRLVDIAIDSGINFFDTADIYSFGASEKILGKALGSRRDEIVICTKVRKNVNRTQNLNDEGLSRYHLINACNESLERLGTDYIDIYMLHNIDKDTPIEETMRSLDYLVNSGKVRYIGCSNFKVWMLMKALCISEKYNLEKFITFQGYYSLLSREIEHEYVPLCQDQGLGIMCWSPLSGGFLTGKFREDRDFPEGSRIGDVKGGESNFIPPIDREKGFKIVRELERISKNHNASIAQAALNYLLNKPAVSSVVIGTRKEEQLLDNIKAVEWNMTPQEIETLDSISEPPNYYPYWQHKMLGID